MGKVIWDPLALEQVHAIYDYYYDNASPKVALDLLNDIMSAPDILLQFPQAGAKEPIFQGTETEFRYLVVRKNWKIIYFQLNEACHIAVIWDVRNDPDTLRATLSNI